MAITDISWTVGWATWCLTAGSGVPLMLAERKPHIRAANVLFWLSPFGPMAADLLWILIDHPPWFVCAIVSGTIGAIVGVTLLEALRWIDVYETNRRNDR
jgi:hypothetical protein